MGPARTIGASMMVAILALTLPRVGWVAFDTYILDNPDFKFGANGGVMITAMLAAACGLIVGFVVVIFGTGTLMLKHQLDERALLYTAFIVGIVMSWPSYYVPRLPGWGYETPLAEFGGMAANWALICLPMVALVYYVVRTICRLTAQPTRTRA
jgi:hypothetical protein